MNFDEWYTLPLEELQDNEPNPTHNLDHFVVYWMRAAYEAGAGSGSICMSAEELVGMARESGMLVSTEMKFQWERREKWEKLAALVSTHFGPYSTPRQESFNFTETPDD